MSKAKRFNRYEADQKQNAARDAQIFVRLTDDRLGVFIANAIAGLAHGIAPKRIWFTSAMMKNNNLKVVCKLNCRQPDSKPKCQSGIGNRRIDLGVANP